jgi:hypothetical protein
MSRRGNWAALLTTLGVVLLVGGCGKKESERYEVTGEVTYKGQPIEEGIINFEPQENQGSSSGDTILNGKYRVPKNKGLFPGKYKVALYAGDGFGGSGTAGAAAPDPRKRPPPGAKLGVERFPPEYNTKSTQIVEVTTDGPNKFDFHVK